VPVLSIENVSFNYPGGVNLYSDVDFGVDLQTRVALVGPNGAGTFVSLSLSSSTFGFCVLTKVLLLTWYICIYFFSFQVKRP
jgi:ABC-type multidrug transport system fused ATPase/permease subunit